MFVQKQNVDVLYTPFDKIAGQTSVEFHEEKEEKEEKNIMTNSFPFLPSRDHGEQIIKPNVQPAPQTMEASTS
ncbi:DUF3951 domain-containing protein [Melghirimyces algeriensis]|uniref:DUF3951 domain-containing protein n=1 Tax=Melghirimyces algeriensis TaxID=910412 RepID=UPI00319E27B9